MNIRRARPSDAEALGALNTAFNGPSPNSSAASIAALLEDNPQELVYIAYVGGEAAGFACAQLWRSVCYPSPCADIRELFVAPEHRRRGLARALLDALERELRAQGVEEAFLATGQDNKEARSLYEALGFALMEECVYSKSYDNKKQHL